MLPLYSPFGLKINAGLPPSPGLNPLKNTNQIMPCIYSIFAAESILPL